MAPREERFFLGQLSFPSLQIRFAMRCSHHLQFHAEKGEWEGWGSELHPRRLSVSSYTAFGHSGSFQANKSQVIIMRMCTPASPPRHTILEFQSVLRRGINRLGIPHTVGHDESMVQQITIYYPESHCSCFAIISTLQDSSIDDDNQSGRKFFISSSWSPRWPRPLCFTELILILHPEDILPRDLDQILSSYQNTICVEHYGSIRYPNSPRPPSQLELHHLLQQLKLTPYNLEIFPNFKASKILVRKTISCATRTKRLARLGPDLLGGI